MTDELPTPVYTVRSLPLTKCLTCGEDCDHWRFHVTEKHWKEFGELYPEYRPEQAYVAIHVYNGDVPELWVWSSVVGDFRTLSQARMGGCHNRMTTCLECGETMARWKMHIVSNHPELKDLPGSERGTIQGYILKHKHGGVRPLCACGCGAQTPFRIRNAIDAPRFNEYIRWHRVRHNKQKKLARSETRCLSSKASNESVCNNQDSVSDPL